jgi:hypothetical protein
MELTYENMVNFMDTYFKDYNKYGGDPKTLPNMLKYYVPEIELHSFTLNAVRPFYLDGILGAMTHPGLHEEFTPRYYVVDERRKVVVIQLMNQFTEESTNKSYPSKELSVHYYLTQDKNRDIKIYKIFFFTEPRPPDEANVMELMKKYREAASEKK